VLPLFRKKGLLSGARLRSIPVFSYGGPLAADERLEARLVEAARDLAAADGEVAGSWRKTSNNLFRSLKKADAAGLRFKAGDSPRDLRSFHRLYVRTMKKHRTLPRSLRQLRLASATLGGSVRLFLVEHGGQDVAGGVYHMWGDSIELVYNGSFDAALQLRPNHALYWNVMRWAAEPGVRQLDLGGAYAGTPLARFKEQWGATPRARYRLTYRAGGEPTRAESIASIGYGAEESQSRLMDALWRWVPAPVLRAGAHVAYRYV
jgi:hypothetical protein